MTQQHDALGGEGKNPPPPNVGPDLGDVVIAGRHYLRLEQLAARLGVSPRTLARWDARRIGPPRITIGRTILYDTAKLADWLSRFETDPVRAPRRRSV